MYFSQVIFFVEVVKMKTKKCFGWFTVIFFLLCILPSIRVFAGSGPGAKVGCKKNRLAV